jgi:hypothetical protein
VRSYQVSLDGYVRSLVRSYMARPAVLPPFTKMATGTIRGRYTGRLSASLRTYIRHHGIFRRKNTSQKQPQDIKRLGQDRIAFCIIFSPMTRSPLNIPLGRELNITNSRLCTETFTSLRPYRHSMCFTLAWSFALIERPTNHHKMRPPTARIRAELP